MPVKESIGVGPVHLVGILKPPKFSHQGGGVIVITGSFASKVRTMG